MASMKKFFLNFDCGHKKSWAKKIPMRVFCQELKVSGF